MSEEKIVIGYDDYMPQYLQERLKIFNEISAENRAFLVKTHVERWLVANRPRLTSEQIAVVEEIIPFITPEKYQAERDMEKIEREAEILCGKVEALFSREDVIQIMSNRADYVPPIENKKS